MSRQWLKRSRSLGIDVKRHWSRRVVRSTPTWISLNLDWTRWGAEQLFSFDVIWARRYRCNSDARRRCRRCSSSCCCCASAQVVLIVVRVVLQRRVAFALSLVMWRRLSRRCRRSSECDGVVVKSTKFRRLPNLWVDAVIKTNQSQKRQESCHDDFRPIPEINSEIYYSVFVLELFFDGWLYWW